MEKKQILVVDDEMAINKVVAYYLKHAGFAVTVAKDGNSALEAIKATPFALIILDIMLPDISGLEIAALLKADPKTAGIPIMFLTAKVDTVDILTGFELQADDYITKPFSPAILSAKVKAILRLLEPPTNHQDNLYVFDCGLIVIPACREVFVNNNKIELNKAEYELLEFLIRHNGQALARAEITAHIKSRGVGASERGLDLLVMNLRKKIAPCDTCIHTVRSFGYKFLEPV